METLFRFLLKRPAVNQNDISRRVVLGQSSKYQLELAKSLSSTNARDLLKKVTFGFIETSNYITSTEKIKIKIELEAFSTRLNDLEDSESVSRADMTKAIKDSFGVTPAATIKKKEYKEAMLMLKDSITAIKILPEEHQKPLETLCNALRDLEVINSFITDSSFPETGTRLRLARKASMKLPSKADLRSILSTKEKETKLQEKLLEDKKLLDEKIKKKIKNFKNIEKTIKDIMSLDNQHLDSTPQQAHGGSMPPKELRPLTIFAENIHRMQTLGQLEILNARTQIEKGINIFGSFSQERPSGVTDKVLPTNNFISGVGEFKPLSDLENTFKFKSGTQRLLSGVSQKILSSRNLDVTSMPIDAVVSKLHLEMNNLSNDLTTLTSGFVTKSFKRVGNAMVVMDKPMKSSWVEISGLPDSLIPRPPSSRPKIPNTKGIISPVGVADLILVKQQLKAYEGKDVAHIENVLKGESKIRDHRRLRQTEEITFTETETTTTEERELESTDRFELSRETNTTIKTDASLKAGLSISGSYGPVVEFSASAEGSLSRSKEEATKVASTFSKDVTQRSSEKLTERILQRAQMKVTNEVEEKNNHTLNNVAGVDHISGIYQWVEKVYEAQMFNYGLRMMFDFMIPEPGAYLIKAMQNSHAALTQIEKPLPFTKKPNQIFESNYNYWVHLYGAGGINPPPEEYITKSWDYHAGGGDSNTDYNHSGIIQIDDGYEAVQATIGRVRNQWEDNNSLDVVIGRRIHRFSNSSSWVWITNLNNEVESIPFGLNTYKLSDIAIAGEVKCKRTNRAFDKWQLNTHAKLMDAYQAKLADYEETLAALEMQSGIEIEGKNPALNLEMMKDELKKNCISIITDQHFDLFDAIQTGSNELPQINLDENEAEGPYVRFFEQAFEWEHITWVTYPYFWGQKSQWEERIAFDDPDPLFNQFLKAGYCRVTIPVRPGFEGAIDHFTTFGELWNGGSLPAISNPLYLAISDELAERLDRPSDEIPQGDPWEVRVPTSLVHLRADDKLPKWEKDAQGNWNPV